MGVPLLLTWLRKYFPNCFFDPAAIGSVDNFYVDLNSLLYPAVNLAADRLVSSKSSDGSDWSVTLHEAEDAILLALHTLLEHVCTLANPQKLLYIAADGVSPIGKMSHQRLRRQHSTARSGAKRLCDASGFDITALTCGSAFMERVTHSAHYFAVKYLERVNLQRRAAHIANLGGQGSDDRESSLLVDELLTAIVNDATSPGEGEHKIFEAMRSFRNQSDMSHNVRHCVCSSDTDVVVSSLALHEPFVYVLRYDPSGPHDPTAFSIQHFREALYRRLGSPASSDVFERSLHDFVFVLLLFGNDFLPRISATADIAEGTLDRLLQFLADNFVSRGKRLVDEVTSEIHIEAAVYLFDYLLEISPATAGGLQVHNDGDMDWGFDAAAASSEDTGEAAVRLVEQRCFAYWTMLQWAMKYSCGPVPSWNAAYPYTVVPTVEELRKHCGLSWATVAVKEIADRPLDVLAQLVILTPAHSVQRVLPAALQQDYKETIGGILAGPFEGIPINTVVQWCRDRKPKLTAAENKRLNSYDSGGVVVAAYWDANEYVADIAASRSLRGQSNSSHSVVKAAADPLLKPLETLFSTSRAAPLSISSLPGLGSIRLGVPATTRQPTTTLPVAKSEEPLTAAAGSAVSLSVTSQDAVIKRSTFSTRLKSLPPCDTVALSRIDGGAFINVAPFSSGSASVVLARCSASQKVLLRFCQASAMEEAEASPVSWKPLPQSLHANIVEAIQAACGGSSTLAADGGKIRQRDSAEDAADEEQRRQKLRLEQQQRRLQAQKELDDARLQQQLRLAMRQPGPR